jgi:hypothetical protein
MDQHRKTIAATDEAAWRDICREIAAAGFRAVEVWEAHAAPEALDEAKARLWKRILDDHGLTPIAYAGGLRPETLRMCQWLGIPHVDGGLRDNTPEKATALCREHGVRFNIENHPEKSAEEILAKIGGGTSGSASASTPAGSGRREPRARDDQACAPFVRHTHIKDVKAAGSTRPASSARARRTWPAAWRRSARSEVRRLVLVGGRARGPQPHGRGGAQPRVDRDAAGRVS